MKSAMYHVLDYSEFEGLVQEHLKVEDYSFLAGEESGNDTCHKFEGITGKPLDDYYIKRIYTDNNWMWCAIDLLQMLIYIAELPEGNYLIDVSY